MLNSFSRARLWGTGLALTAAAIGGVALFDLKTGDAQAKNPAAAPAAPSVSVAVVEQRKIDAWDEFSGRLEAVERVDVRARISGAVQTIHFREGSLVKQGDLLITIDPEPYAAEVDRAKAQVTSAEARLSFTTSELERGQRLVTTQAIPQRDLDSRLNARREADAALRAAQAVLQSAKLNLGYTAVRAPVAGRVGKAEITVGNLVAAGPTAPVLTTLVSVSPIYASFDADEKSVLRALSPVAHGADDRDQIQRIPVQMGTSATSETPYNGHLQLIDNTVDARSGTVRVRAVFDNADGRLMPGQFARLRMGQAEQTSAVLINERAVGTDQDKKFVLVVGNDNKTAYREVQLGGAQGGLRTVKSGLAEGERIVVNGIQRIRPGDVIAPQIVPMNTKTTAQAASATIQQ